MPSFVNHADALDALGDSASSAVATRRIAPADATTKDDDARCLLCRRRRRSRAQDEIKTTSPGLRSFADDAKAFHSVKVDSDLDSSAIRTVRLT